jgi:hypothetical protein
MPTIRQLKAECDRVTILLTRTPFSKALPLSTDFKGLTHDTGIYVLISENQEILYCGKANSFKTRFKSGHQTLVTLFISGVAPTSVRIICAPIKAYYVPYLLSIEKQVIFDLKPRYNSNIPSSDEVNRLMQLKTSPPSGHLETLLGYLPDPIVEGIEAYAESHNFSVPQVLELALAGFLDLDAVSFGEISGIETPGQIKERMAIQEIQIKALRAVLEQAGIPDPTVYDDTQN